MRIVSFVFVSTLVSLLLTLPSQGQQPEKVPLAQKLANQQELLIPQVPEIAKDEVLFTPDSSVRWAMHDIMTIAETERPYVRYLSLYNIPQKDRAAVGQTVSFVVNSLGTRKYPYIPSFVDNSNQTVIRININDYNWKAEVWENFAKKGSGVRPFPEPYFHVNVVELIPKQIENHGEKTTTQTVPTIDKGSEIELLTEANVWEPGKAGVLLARLPVGTKVKVVDVHKERGLYMVPTPKGNGWIERDKVRVEIPPLVIKERKPAVQLIPGNKKTFSHAPWLNASVIGELCKQTESQAPIVRADWFIANAIVPPAYYDFLGIKVAEDFEKLIFANEKVSTDNHLQDKGVVIKSSVARNNRTLTRSSTLTNGYYWVSHDTLHSVDDRRYIQNVLDENFDATEDIGTLPNGLHAYLLTAKQNGKNVRQDFANPDVAIDNTAVDRIVRPGRSCMICHSDGIRPIDDELRKITEFFKNVEQTRLLIPDIKNAYRVKDLFGTNMTKVVRDDQQKYQDAVNAVTGLDMRKNASQLGEIYDGYAEYLLTKEAAQREVGLPMQQLEAYIRRSSDPIILGMIKNPVRPLRRDQWEESFAEFMKMIVTTPLDNPHQGVPPVALPPEQKR